MATFENLEIEKFYLVKLKEDSDIILVQVLMQTNTCVLVWEYKDPADGTFWKKKNDFIAEILEELTEDQLDDYESTLYDDWDEDEDEYSLPVSKTFDKGEAEQEEEQHKKSNKKKKKK